MKRAASVLTLAVAVVAIASFAPAQTPAAPTGQWLAGDLHIHTIYGHDTCISPTESWDNAQTDPNARRACEEPWTWSFSPQERVEEAELRGLDFIAITDHNNVMSQRDPYIQAYNGPLVVIPAYENSMAGHVQMLGARDCYNNDGPVPGRLVECHRIVTDRSATGMTNLANALRLDAGVFQINHPSDHDWEQNYGHSVVPDTVEVWNIGAWFYQPPNLASNDNDFSLAFWDAFLSAGYRVAATGGSDSHWRITSSEQGIGQPTTWVYSSDRSVVGILQALGAGRTFISHQHPLRGGTLVYLEADSDHDGEFESMVGDTLSLASSFRVRWANAVPGSLLRIVTDNGMTEVPLLATTQDITGAVSALNPSKYLRVEIRLPDAQEARVSYCDSIVREIEAESGGELTITECRNRVAVLALTSPIYISE